MTERFFLFKEKTERKRKSLEDERSRSVAGVLTAGRNRGKFTVSFRKYNIIGKKSYERGR